MGTTVEQVDPYEGGVAHYREPLEPKVTLWGWRSPVCGHWALVTMLKPAVGGLIQATYVVPPDGEPEPEDGAEIACRHCGKPIPAGALKASEAELVEPDHPASAFGGRMARPHVPCWHRFTVEIAPGVGVKVSELRETCCFCPESRAIPNPYEFDGLDGHGIYRPPGELG